MDAWNPEALVYQPLMRLIHTLAITQSHTHTHKHTHILARSITLYVATVKR